MMIFMLAIMVSLLGWKIRITFVNDYTLIIHFNYKFYDSSKFAK